MDKTRLKLVTLSAYANGLSNALNEAPLSIQILCQALYYVGFHNEFNFISY